MGTALGLIKGWAGKPSHPPLTDVSVGAYAVGIAMLVLGALGIEREQMAHGSLLAIGGGLALALPTAITGLLDWLEISKGTALWRVATAHLVFMLAATALFALTFAVQLNGYDTGEVATLAWILGLAAGAVLGVGGYLGGAIVFVYGMRVLGHRDASVADALIPGRSTRDCGGPGRERANHAADEKGGGRSGR